MNAVPARFRSWKWIIIALIAADIASIFEISMVFSALPTFYRLFDDPALVGWTLTGFMLIAAAAAAIGGRLGDIFGRSQVLIAMSLLALLGSLISACSDGLTGLIIGRSIQGVSAAVLPLCFGLVQEHAPAHRVPLGIGIVAGTASFAAGIGFVLGGLTIDYLNWHWIFYISSAVAALCLVVVLLLLPASVPPARRQQLDVVGGVLFAPGIAGLLFALSKGASWGWLDPSLLGIGLGSLLLLGFWGWYEAQHANPLIDVRLFSNRQLALTNLIHALIGMGAMHFALVIFPLLQQPVATGAGLGLAATMAAVLKLPSSLVAVFASPLAGTISGRHGARRAMLIALTFLTIGWTALTLQHGNFWFIAVIVAVNGIGTAMAFSAIPNLIAEEAPQDRISEINGLTQVVRMTFMAIGAQLYSMIFAAHRVVDPLNPGASYLNAEGFNLAFGVITFFCVLALGVATLLPRRRVPMAVAA
jgi:EmrB/QacA subfamily drug resistance transporter